MLLAVAVGPPCALGYRSLASPLLVDPLHQPPGVRGAMDEDDSARLRRLNDVLCCGRRRTPPSSVSASSG
jgi:hypothetical protein